MLIFTIIWYSYLINFLKNTFLKIFDIYIFLWSIIVVCIKLLLQFVGASSEKMSETKRKEEVLILKIATKEQEIQELNVCQPTLEYILLLCLKKKLFN